MLTYIFFILSVISHNLTNIYSEFAVKFHKGWMDALGFYVPSTVFQSFRDDGRVNMKGSVQ